MLTNDEILSWAARNPNFEFAQSIAQSLRTYGRLTDNQTAAVERCIARDMARAATPPVVAKAIDISKIEEAFARARENGGKQLRLRLANFIFSPAPPTGANPGAVYVKSRGEGREYYGKVVNGQLRCVDAGRPYEAEIIAAAADPLSAAKAYGHQFGECSICGRELTDPASIAAGIGPVCASKWGF